MLQQEGLSKNLETGMIPWDFVDKKIIVLDPERVISKCGTSARW